MANATPALQAAPPPPPISHSGHLRHRNGVAMNIRNFTGVVGTNVSGTSDLAPLDQQAQMIKEPPTPRPGLLYCSTSPTASIRWIPFRAIWRAGLHLHPVRLLRFQRRGRRVPEPLTAAT